MICEHIKALKEKIGGEVELVAVSKTKPAAAIQEAYDCGQRVFGENKVQEMCAKYEMLPKDIEWHMIGHLQSNKVKYMAPFVRMIHGVDSFKLLQEIDKQGKKNDRVINCLLQFHIAQEETKFGLSLEEALNILASEEFLSLKNIAICGVMGMATFTDKEEQVRAEFRSLHDYFQRLKSEFFKMDDHFKHISMGMSGDYRLAIDEGSTMIRVGSSIFGAR